MSLADEMRNLIEEIKVGKAQRKRRLGEIKKETAEDLSDFASTRKEMAAGLRETLKASAKTIKEEVSTMRRGFRAEHEQVKEEIQAMQKVWEGTPEPSEKQRKKKTYPKG